MKGKKPIIKFTTIFTYIVALYYLLPFSPVNLYLSSQQKSVPSFNEIKNERPCTFSYHKILVRNNTAIVSKDKNRFDVQAFIGLTPSLQKVSFSYTAYSLHYLIFHSDPLIHCNSNRGPPVLQSFAFTQS